MGRLTFGISISQSPRWKRDRSTAAASAGAGRGMQMQRGPWGWSDQHPKAGGPGQHPPTPSHLCLPPSQLWGREVHLQLWVLILSNRGKKNHKG